MTFETRLNQALAQVPEYQDWEEVPEVKKALEARVKAAVFDPPLNTSGFVSTQNTAAYTRWFLKLLTVCCCFKLCSISRAGRNSRGYCINVITSYHIHYAVCDAVKWSESSRAKWPLTIFYAIMHCLQWLSRQENPWWCLVQVFVWQSCTLDTRYH